MSAVLTISCDRCGKEVRPRSMDVRSARDGLYLTRGWATRTEGGKVLDLCPACQEGAK